MFEIDLECGLKTIPVRCSTNHCQNQGVCYVDQLNVSKCVCPLGTNFNSRISFSFLKFSFIYIGFAGDLCQHNINECQSNPCPKQSKCIDLPNGYRCDCGMIKHRHRSYERKTVYIY